MELIDLWILKHFASLTLLNWIYENIWFMEWIMTAIKNLYVWIKLKIVYGMWNFLVSYCLNFILLNMNIWTLLECWRYADHIDAWSGYWFCALYLMPCCLRQKPMLLAWYLERCIHINSRLKIFWACINKKKDIGIIAAVTLGK